MHKVKYIIILLIISLVSGSCYNRAGREQLTRAEALLEQGYADSAANELDTLYLANDMGKKYYMQYLIAKVQANYKAYRDIKRDTAILQAVEYYEKKGKTDMLALACYSAGCVMRERGEDKECLSFYKRAEQVLSLTNNYSFQGLIAYNIGEVYQKQSLNSTAIQYFEKALAYYSKTKTEKTPLDKMDCLNALGLNYLLEKKNDSALTYFNKSLKIAQEINNIAYQAAAFNNTGLSYKEIGENAKAAHYYKMALSLNQSQVDKNKQYLGLAQIFLDNNQLDSLALYIPILEKSLITSDDIYYKSGVNSFLSNYFQLKGNFQKAVSHMRDFNTAAFEILDKNQSKALIEAEKEFDFTQKEMETEKAKQIQRNTVFFSMLFVAALIILGLMLRKRNLLRQKIKETALVHEKEKKETENKALAKRLQLFNYSADQYKTLIAHTQILHNSIHNIAEAGWFKENSKQFEKIINALQSTENVVVANMGEIAKTFFREQHLLPEKVIETCSNEDLILLHRFFIGDKRNDIAALFNIKSHTLTQRISRLKEKLKPLLSESDFKAFFE